MKGENLGELEELVLLAVYSLEGDAYGVTVQQAIEGSADRSCTLGAVYSALDRLERKDCVRSRMGGRTAQIGGRRKRFFDITTRGRRKLEQSRAAREALWSRVRSQDV